MGWWQRFRDMPDRDRARRVAWIAAGALVVFIYLLGGASLYVRGRYLGATPTPSPTATVTVTPDATTMPAPTLLPTMTPPGR